MKKIRSIIILLAVLALLVGVYLFASPMWSEQTDADTDTDAAEHTVAVIDHNSLVGLELTADEDTLKFALNDDFTAWNWSENAEVPLDNTVFAEIVEALNAATTRHILENVDDERLAEYGLAEPAYTVKFIFSDGAEKQYLLGDLNSFNNSCYFSEASDPKTVYTVPSSVADAMDMDIYDFILEETPPVITEGKIISAEYESQSGQIKSFKYFPSGNEDDYTDKYNWYYYASTIRTVSYNKPLNRNIANSLTELITSLSFDECVGLDHTDSKYGFSEAHRFVIKYNVDEGETGVLSEKEYVIYIGAQTEDGEIYAHTDNSKLVYTLDAPDEWLKIINGNDKDFSASEIWLPNYELIESVNIKGGGSLTVVPKTEDGKTSFFASGYDSEKVGELMTALEALSAISHTSVLDEDPNLEKENIFGIYVRFKDSEKAQEEIFAESYTENYCKVTFRNDKNGITSTVLIAAEDAQKIASLVADITAKAE